MKKIVLLLISCICISVFSSCQSKEESTISKMEALVEKVEQKGDELTDAEWDKVQEQFSAVLEAAKTCNFTSEQQEKLGKLEGKFTLLVAKQAGKDFGKGLKDLFKKGKGIIEGVTEELKDLEESLNN